MTQKKILFVAIGGGALKICEHLPLDKWSNVNLLCIDTDNTALKNVTGIKILVNLEDAPPIGNNEKLNTVFCKSCPQKYLAEITECFRDIDIVVMVACLGGSTASVLAPQIARKARQAGLTVISIASLPDRWEPHKKFPVSLIAFQKLRNNSDSIIVFPLPVYFYLARKHRMLEKFEKSHMLLILSCVSGIIDFVANPNNSILELKGIFRNNRMYYMGNGDSVYNAFNFPGIREIRNHCSDIFGILTLTENAVFTQDNYDEIIGCMNRYVQINSKNLDNVHLFVQIDDKSVTNHISLFAAEVEQDNHDNSLRKIYKNYQIPECYILDDEIVRNLILTVTPQGKNIYRHTSK